MPPFLKHNCLHCLAVVNTLGLFRKQSVETLTRAGLIKRPLDAVAESASSGGQSYCRGKTRLDDHPPQNTTSDERLRSSSKFSKCRLLFFSHEQTLDPSIPSVYKDPLHQPNRHNSPPTLPAPPPNNKTIPPPLPPFHYANDGDQ